MQGLRADVPQQIQVPPRPALPPTPSSWRSLGLQPTLLSVLDIKARRPGLLPATSLHWEQSGCTWLDRSCRYFLTIKGLELAGGPNRPGLQATGTIALHTAGKIERAQTSVVLPLPGPSDTFAIRPQTGKFRVQRPL